MAGSADDGQPIPRVGLRFTLRFQAVDAAEDVVSRTWLCRKVIMEQLNLNVDAIYYLQWNQQEKAFDVTLKDEQVYTKVAKDCVAAAMLKPLACYKEGHFESRGERSDGREGRRWSADPKSRAEIHTAFSGS
ncbi:hypothetical protein JOQ06_000184 [Pogonophryne albipinna]|uniref:Zinc finger CCHC domain-containing protein n=1 Tax=Pogonophryne albipinna TaxID=1090488 RepID=A0AAD6A4I7_9TELE|nr:hypothetical protein JOQ06_000184 [Pogonophryne albipinna]